MPLAVLRPRPNWTPCLSDVLLVTRKRRDVVWVWNESPSDSRQGVGLLTSQRLLGPGELVRPAPICHVMIQRISYDEEGMMQLEMFIQEPRDPSGTQGIWMLRWLHGM